MLSSLNLEKVNCSIIKGDTLEFVKVQKIADRENRPFLGL
jgi:hypothetical protein